MAPILIVGGAVLAMAGWTDVALFYYPSQFASSEWEFGVIARTFEAMPLPTLGLLLVLLGLRARGGHAAWHRAMAVALALVAALCCIALVLFSLDIPLALRTMQRASTASDRQAGALVAMGLKRVIAKTLLFGVGYAAAYGWLAMTAWRVRQHPARLVRED